LEKGVPLEDVQRLAGHADSRTTRPYDQRDKNIARNIVEQISRSNSTQDLTDEVT
jgi:site-specific recombinase XerD